MQLDVPATHLLELLYAEVKELCLNLRQKHIFNVVVLSVVKVVELEPEAHHLGVEVRTWLDELDVHVLWRLSCGGCHQLHLLLDDLLLLLLKLVDEVVSELEDHSDEVAGD